MPTYTDAKGRTVKVLPHPHEVTHYQDGGFTWNTICVIEIDTLPPGSVIAREAGKPATGATCAQCESHMAQYRRFLHNRGLLAA